LIDVPRHEQLTTALVVNIDQAQSEIVALNPQQSATTEKVEKSLQTKEKPVTAPIATQEVAEIIVAEQPQVETTETKPVLVQQPAKRANNDPRQKRRQQQSIQAKVVAPKITPSQVPTLKQYTVGSLIRHTYGDDCAVLIEQFGLIPTFNRALLKFTEEYAATLTVETTDAVVKAPVTRDVAITKAAPETQPAEVLDLTPPKPENDRRVANDPRERRRLAKQAAVQAKQEHQAELEQNQEQSKIEVQPTNTVEPAVIETPVTEAVQIEVQAESPIEPKVIEAPIIESIEETTTIEAKKTQQSLALDQTTEVATDSETQKVETTATDDKPARPRRPRGRPPKKATPPTTE